MHVSPTHKWCKQIMQQNLLKRDGNGPLCCGRWCVLGAIFYYYVYPVNKCETSLCFVVSLAITNPLSSLPLSLFSLTAALQVSISLNKVELSVGESKFFICTGTNGMTPTPPARAILFKPLYTLHLRLFSLLWLFVTSWEQSESQSEESFALKENTIWYPCVCVDPLFLSLWS